LSKIYLNIFSGGVIYCLFIVVSYIVKITIAIYFDWSITIALNFDSPITIAIIFQGAITIAINYDWPINIAIFFYSSINTCTKIPFTTSQRVFSP
jgi:hypothetical protein